MKQPICVVLGIAALNAFGASHIFWYKAVQRGYNLQQANPGPGIPAGAIIHEGMIATAGIAQHTGSQYPDFVFGSGLDDAQGRCAFIWSKDLCDATGTATQALVRAEYRDGYSGNAFCNAGPIAIRCGVVDFQGNLDTWGGVDQVPETADWQDFLNPLGSAMGYDMLTATLGAEETINYTAEAGRPDEFAPAVLDGKFFEVDVTDQVNYVLQNQGQHAIVLLVSIGQGSTGKVNTHTREDGQIQLGSDAPWTQDGNTGHLWVESSDLSVDVERLQAPTSRPALGQNFPNPFRPGTKISYNTGKAEGRLAIFSPAGRLVHSAVLTGEGTYAWQAGPLPGGVYLLRLSAGGQTAVRRMVLVP